MRAVRFAVALATFGAASVASAASLDSHTDDTVPYVAARGDTLYTVAAQYLSEPDDWRVVARLNRIGSPLHIQPGTRLRLPVARLRAEPLAVRVAAASGRVIRVRGTAPAIPVFEGTVLEEGDALSTSAGAFASLTLADGSHLRVSPGSTVLIRVMRRAVLTGAIVRIVDLAKGEVESEVIHAKQLRDRFEIRTPSIVAGVRGTHFRVNAQPAATAVEVLDGAVAVDPSAQRNAEAQAPRNGAQLVPAAHGNLTGEDGVVGAPIVLLAAPELVAPGRVQDGPQVAFTLAPLAGAHSYHVQLARDADLLDLIREVRVTGTEATFADVPDGTYFVRVSGIDEHGLEGMPRVYAFERRANAISASAERRSGTRDYVFRWMAARAAAATHYRFVLARDAALHAPLVDAVDLTDRELVVSDLPSGTYYWTVVAEQFENGRFYETASSVRTFTVACEGASGCR